MASYKMVKYCKHCKKRFVVERGMSQKYYCEECESKFFSNKNDDSKEE